MESNQFLIFVSPRICPPVIRIREPADTRLVPIIDRGRARPCHLDHYRLAKHRFIHARVSRLRSERIRPSHFMVRSCKESGVIVIGQLVHRHQKRRHGKGSAVMSHGSPEIVRITPHIFSVIVAVFLHPCQKPGHRLHKGVIIHDRIPFLPLQPV